MKHRTFFILFWPLFVLFIVGLTTDCAFLADQRYAIFHAGNNFLADFLQQIRYIWNQDPYFDSQTTLSEHIYPPLAYLMITPLTTLLHGQFQSLPTLHELQSHGMARTCALAYGIGSAAVFLSAIILAAGKPRSVKNILPLVLSGIMIFSIERGNLIWTAAIGFALFLLLHESMDPRRKTVAALAIALAISLKIFPAIALVVWLNKKNIRWFLSAGICTCLLGFLPLLFFHHAPLDNALQLLENVSAQGKSYFLDSFACTVNLPGYICGGLRLFLPSLEESVRPLIRIPFVLYGLFCLFVVLTKTMARWERLFLLAAAVILVSNLSMYYTMLYFLPAVYLYLRDAPSDQLNDVLVAILLTPFQFFIPTYDGHGGSIAPCIASIVIITIAVRIMISHLKSK